MAKQHNNRNRNNTRENESSRDNDEWLHNTPSETGSDYEAVNGDILNAWTTNEEGAPLDDDGRENTTHETSTEEVLLDENDSATSEKATKPVVYSELELNELAALIASEDDVSLGQLKAMIKEHRNRSEDLDLSWTLDECVQYLRNGVSPVKPTPAVQLEEVKVPQPTVVLREPVVEQVQLEGLTVMNQKFIEQTLAEYVDKVKPGRSVSQAQGVQAQSTLDKLIRYVINLADPVGFRNGMNIIFNAIKRERAEGVFNDTYAFRFTDGLPTQSGIQLSHIQMLTLFFIYADEDKAAREQYDVQALIKLYPVAKQPLLLQYFTELK